MTISADFFQRLAQAAEHIERPAMVQNVRDDEGLLCCTVRRELLDQLERELGEEDFLLVLMRIEVLSAQSTRSLLGQEQSLGRAALVPRHRSALGLAA